MARRTLNRMALGLVMTVATAILTGCEGLVETTAAQSNMPPVTSSPLPSVLPRYGEIELSLACIRKSRRLNNVTFQVGSFADSTGKINSVAEGATGNFLPQGGSAAFITDTLARAGARVVSTYFGPPERQLSADYAINGIFNSLDFGRNASVDLRAAGIGPVIAKGWAQLTLTIQLDQASTRLNQQMSMIQRPVRYQQYGFGVGRQVNNTLVTGSAAIESQERLQLEALNGPIALGVIDVVTREFPELRENCTAGIADLLTRPVM